MGVFFRQIDCKRNVFYSEMASAAYKAAVKTARGLPQVDEVECLKISVEFANSLRNRGRDDPDEWCKVLDEAILHAKLGVTGKPNDPFYSGFPNPELEALISEIEIKYAENLRRFRPSLT